MIFLFNHFLPYAPFFFVVLRTFQDLSVFNIVSVLYLSVFFHTWLKDSIFLKSEALCLVDKHQRSKEICRIDLQSKLKYFHFDNGSNRFPRNVGAFIWHQMASHSKISQSFCFTLETATISWDSYPKIRGTLYRSLWGHYATSLKVAVSIRYKVIDFFQFT
jgi:hypothetical protein